MNPFDQKASGWDTEGKIERSKALAESIETVLDRRPRTDQPLEAMEYGCGTGLVGLALRDRFDRLVLADSSQGMLEVVKEKLRKRADPKVTAQLLDLSEEVLGDAPADFDVIFSVQTLHHIADIDTTLRNFRALLRPGGTFVLVDMDADGGVFHHDFENFKGHHGFDREWLAQRVREAGFEVNAVSTIYDFERNAEDHQPESAHSRQREPERSTLFLLDATTSTL